MNIAVILPYLYSAYLDDGKEGRYVSLAYIVENLGGKQFKGQRM